MQHEANDSTSHAEFELVRKKTTYGLARVEEATRVRRRPKPSPRTRRLEEGSARSRDQLDDVTIGVFDPHLPTRFQLEDRKPMLAQDRAHGRVIVDAESRVARDRIEVGRR